MNLPIFETAFNPFLYFLQRGVAYPVIPIPYGLRSSANPVESTLPLDVVPNCITAHAVY
jgi:hypothetical protein